MKKNKYEVIKMKFLDVNNVKLESDTSEIDSILEQEEILYAIS